ncbi:MULTISPECIES: hypothetical protein [unclassified Vibrio]|uniref:Dystroglycan-type cadherin-like protein n=1 Tax=Vibrio sp. HB236076 TaxID=3232307 RepID=A0AB39HG07_9VIBR|nr:hypothetical protein [Vibrio sp. HB161653]MDP5254652.1 hypothetical protein [Vibrio sp. HB161653]
MIRITKTAAAIALSIGTLTACNTDLRDSDNSGSSSSSGSSTASALSAGYWELSADASGTSIQAFATTDDLPNVYVFDGTTQKYYNDDDNFGTYTIYTSTFTEDEDAGTITFNYYSDSSDLTNVTELSGNYSVTDGALTITDTNAGDFTGTDNADNTDVTDAITAANAEAGLNNYVLIHDTNNAGAEEDTGELRIRLSDSTDVDSIASGRLTLDVIYQEDEDTTEEDDGSSNNAYISLYASSTSTSSLHGEVIFNDGQIRYRDSNGTLTDTEGTFENGDTLSVEVSWEAEAFSFSVNGVTYGDNLPVADGSDVTVIALRLGDNAGTTNFEVLGDNITIYSSDSGTETSVLEEDFDSYANGLDLSTVYNSSSNEATVFTDGESSDSTDSSEVTDNFDAYTVGDQIDSANALYTVSGVDGETTLANIDDTQSESADNSLYLYDNSAETKPVVARSFTNGAAESGSVSTSVYIPAEGYEKSSYLYLGTSESGSSSSRFTEVVFGSTEVKFRNESGSQVALANYAQDTWVDVTIAWQADDSDGYDITVTVDGVEYTTYSDDSGTSFDLKAENDTGAPSLFALYVGDSSSVGTYTYFDNLDSDLFD